MFTRDTELGDNEIGEIVKSALVHKQRLCEIYYGAIIQSLTSERDALLVENARLRKQLNLD